MPLRFAWFRVVWRTILPSGSLAGRTGRLHFRFPPGGPTVSQPPPPPYGEPQPLGYAQLYTEGGFGVPAAGVDQGDRHRRHDPGVADAAQPLGRAGDVRHHHHRHAQGVRAGVPHVPGGQLDRVRGGGGRAVGRVGRVPEPGRVGAADAARVGRRLPGAAGRGHRRDGRVRDPDADGPAQQRAARAGGHLPGRTAGRCSRASPCWCCRRSSSSISGGRTCGRRSRDGDVGQRRQAMRNQVALSILVAVAAAPASRPATPAWLMTTHSGNDVLTVSADGRVGHLVEPRAGGLGRRPRPRRRPRRRPVRRQFSKNSTRSEVLRFATRPTENLKPSSLPAAGWSTRTT